MAARSMPADVVAVARSGIGGGVMWRGEPGPYAAISPVTHAGGGSVQSRPTGVFRPIIPGVHGGGGRVQSTGQVLQGLGGCGGPGPGALIGLR